MHQHRDPGYGHHSPVTQQGHVSSWDPSPGLLLSPPSSSCALGSGISSHTLSCWALCCVQLSTGRAQSAPAHLGLSSALGAVQGQSPRQERRELHCPARFEVTELSMVTNTTGVPTQTAPGRDRPCAHCGCSGVPREETAPHTA